MALPFFYVEVLESNSIVLDEDTSKYIVQVLRMEKTNRILLTNGKGKKAEAEIIDDNRKRCVVKILSEHQEDKRIPHVAIALSLIKNTSRFEWFLEKAAEIGVSEIIPLICERTEKEKFRMDRMKSILVSAMLQSQQIWLPLLHHPMPFSKAIELDTFQQKFIAHCLPGQKQIISTNGNDTSLILIGPEGDFSGHEIELAFKKEFQPVALGQTRLRTETAGLVAATLLCVH